MSSPAKVKKIAAGYKVENLHIGVLGSHSALALGMAAKSFGAKTLLIVEKGRDQLYSRDHAHLYDHIIRLDRFKDILRPDVKSELLEYNTVWVPHRSFSVYVGTDAIENEFDVPMYGSRSMLKTEDRNAVRNQYYFLEKADVRFPLHFEKPEQIDRLCLVKVQRSDKPLERAFFYVKSPAQYYQRADEYKKAGLVDDDALSKARIEEYAFGSRINANWHAYALKDQFGDLDLVGFSDRRQVNLQGFLQLPAREQLQMDVPVTNEEVGHYGITARESLHPLFWEAARRFIETVRIEEPPGMIGPFGLQGAITYAPNSSKLEFVVFDVSPRIPGDPAIGPTSPEMRNLSIKFKALLDATYGGRQINDPLDLAVLEIQEAARSGRQARSSHKGDILNPRTEAVLRSYDLKNITIGTICSHSALQIFYGAKQEGFKTVGIIKADRKPVYEGYPAAKPDYFVEVKDWGDILEDRIQKQLIDRNTIIVPHGSFVEYIGPSNIKGSFSVPMLGNQGTLEWEEDRSKQREWLQKAGLHLPREFASPEDIDRRVFVKFRGAKGGKGFFTASSPQEYYRKLGDRIKLGLIKEEDAKYFTIQEFLPGVRYYPHYFFSPLDNSAGYHIRNGVLSHMGFDKRIEPVDEAYRALPDVPPELMDYTITGNQMVTLRESLLPFIWEMGKNTVEASQELMPPGMIGPFSLETFYHPTYGFTVFEISARIVAGTNPFGQGSEYSIWTYGQPISTGRRIAMEIKSAVASGQLEKIVS